MIKELHEVPMAAYDLEAQDGAIEYLQDNDELLPGRIKIQGVKKIHEDNADWIVIYHQKGRISLLEDDCMISPEDLRGELIRITGLSPSYEITLQRADPLLVAAIIDELYEPIYCSQGFDLQKYLETHDI